MQALRVRGFTIWKGFIDAAAQVELLGALRSVVAEAPLFSPVTPSGKAMSVRMTSAGDFGWISDKRGYRYSENHPRGTTWPKIPQMLLDVWGVAGVARLPDSCLINFYGADAKMGMHRDEDEADNHWPVVSISLGDDGLFRMGGPDQGGATDTVWLQSGDVVVMGGDARLSYHGIDKIRFGSSRLLSRGGRINVTMRISQ